MPKTRALQRTIRRLAGQLAQTRADQFEDPEALFGVLDQLELALKSLEAALCQRVLGLCIPGAASLSWEAAFVIDDETPHAQIQFIEVQNHRGHTLLYLVSPGRMDVDRSYDPTYVARLLGLDGPEDLSRNPVILADHLNVLEGAFESSWNACSRLVHVRIMGEGAYSGSMRIEP